MKVDYAYTQSCVVVRMVDNNVYIRHSSDCWEHVVGLASESVANPTELETTYQQYLFVEYSRTSSRRKI